MMKINRGYSMIVLVIIIAVIMMITTSSIMGFKNSVQDKDISKFIKDISEVRDYVIEYYFENEILPIGTEKVFATSLIASQISPDDSTEYYDVDLNKLGKIQLESRARGYVVNPKTLNIYVLYERPSYKGITYCTITDELSGKPHLKQREIRLDVSGIPVMWTDTANIKLSVNATAPIIKYASGVHDDVSEGVWTNVTNNGTFVATQNGIYTIYVSANNQEFYRKIIIRMIDDIAPVFSNTEHSIIDYETGIKEILCKKVGEEKFWDISLVDYINTDEVIVKAIDYAGNESTKNMLFAELLEYIGLQ